MTNQLQQQQQQQQRRAVSLRIPTIEKYAYCLCLHVKPTTIFIAVFKLIRALLFASMILNYEFAGNDQFNETTLALEDRHRSTTAAVSILTRIVMASVSAVGIYAVVSGKAGLLMPLYAVLLVDFFFALPAFYNRDLDSSFADSLDDLRNYSNGNKQYTRYSLMLFSTITMIVKIYFLCVVWKCYRYLRLIELVAPIRMSEIYPHIHHAPRYPIVRVVEDSTDLNCGLQSLAPPPYESISSSMKPPNYEEAIKSTTINFATNPLPSVQEPVSSINVQSEQQIDLSSSSSSQQIILHQSEPTQANAESSDNRSETTTTAITNPSTEICINPHTITQANPILSQNVSINASDSTSVAINKPNYEDDTVDHNQ